MERRLAPLGLALLATTSFAQNVMKAEPFALNEVRLLSGPFQDANKVCVSYLETVDADRLLHGFRKNSGLEPKGKIYAGWESMGLAGHTLGHFLTACAQEYASSKNPKLKQKIDYIVAELTECQKNRTDGYIAAMPDGDRVWNEVKIGNIRSGGFDLNGLWSPWYTHHKVLSGLIDVYNLEGNKSALMVATKFADWMIEETRRLDDAQWEKMLVCEYGGMNEALAELYDCTKKTQYLDLARKFYDHKILDPLSEGKDNLPGKHSNTQIPKIIGLARLFELTKTSSDAQTTKFFWHTIVKHHTYAIGGNSNHEYLGPPDKLNDRLSTNTCETCNTYNMLKLTRHMFEWDPQAQYADYYERAHLNHILASQDPETGGVTYFMPLSSGSFREYSDREFNFTCCHGSGMENHTKHADSIYFHTLNQRLYVNLFIPSEVTWLGQKVKQETNFPNDGKVTITISGAIAKNYELAIRHPYWATDPVQIKVNGKVVATSNRPSSYILVKRLWRQGDKVEFTLPMSLHTEAMPDNPKRVAVMYGPLVLGADLAPDRKTAIPRLPVLVDNGHPVSEWLTKDPSSLVFKTTNAGRPNELTFLPFYQLHRNRYAVYLDRFTDQEWQVAEQEYRAEEERQKDLLARTVDSVRIGEMQPERDHNLKSERNDVRDSDGRNFRSVLSGGWFEVDLKVDTTMPMELVVTYWGNERMRPNFIIAANGNQLAMERLQGKPTNKFFDVVYRIPTEQSAESKVLTIRVEALDGGTGPSIAGMRMVKSKG